MKYHWAPLVVQKIKNPPAMQEAQVQSLRQKVSLQKEMETYFIFFSLENSMQRILVCYSPWGSKELDMTEQLTL